MILLLNKDKGDKHYKLLETFKDTKEVALKKRDDITARLIKENGYRYLFLNLISINHKGVKSIYDDTSDGSHMVYIDLSRLSEMDESNVALNAYRDCRDARLDSILNN